MALPILKKDSVSRSGAFPRRLLFALVRHALVELIKLLCFEREVIDWCSQAQAPLVPENVQ